MQQPNTVTTLARLALLKAELEQVRDNFIQDASKTQHERLERLYRTKDALLEQLRDDLGRTGYE